MMELKRVEVDDDEDSEDRSKIEQALEAAMAQIESRRYVEKLVDLGAATVRRWALVFEGKKAYLRGF